LPPSLEASPNQWNESAWISVKRQRSTAPDGSVPSCTIWFPSARPIWRAENPVAGSVHWICQAPSFGS
jgi:hypothetical protein